MGKSIIKTEERVIPEKIDTTEDYLIYLRHFFAYNSSKKLINKDDLILEIGCGEGYGTSFVSGSCREIIGLDVEERIIDHASNKYSSTNCTFKSYSGNKIPYDDNAFDVVITFQTIEHIENDRSFILDVHRVLKKDGMLILTTPNRQIRLKPGQKPWNKFHMREYTIKDLNALLQGVFKEINIKGIFGSDIVQCIELKRINKYQKLVAYDIFNVRKLIPDQFKNILKSNVVFNAKDKNFINNFSLDDFYISGIELDNSLDIIAICIK